MNGICVDLGASGSRITGDNGIIYELPNELVMEDIDTKVNLEVSLSGDKHNDFLAGMDVTITKVAGTPCDMFPARAIIGDLANRYSSALSRPSTMMNKARQPINIINILTAVTHQVYVTGIANPPAYNDVKPITIYLALPPLEVSPENNDETMQILKEKLVGTFGVKLPKLGVDLTIPIEEVKCFPESYMALAAFFFDFPNCTVNRDNASKYGKGYAMSLDIGASTTDITIALNMGYQEKSGQTFKTGGNVIEMHLANSIRSKFGFDPTHESLQQAIREGRLIYGNGYVDVSDMLKRAKREFARSIVSSLQDYFRLTNIPLQSVRVIVVSGGGSLVSGYINEEGQFVKTSESVSAMITEELKNIVDTIDVVSIPDARTANVRGLYIRYKVDKATAAKSA